MLAGSPSAEPVSTVSARRRAICYSSRLMTIVDQISKDLTASMKAQDAPRTSVLRMAKSALKNKEIDKKAHKWIAHDVRIEDVLAKRVSTLSLADARADVAIEDSTFTEQNLSSE